MESVIRVLHAEDDPDIADLTRRYLEREGKKAGERFEVESVTEAAEGLELLSEDGFDCVVADYEMPDTDGIEFLERVREDYPDLPFILFTSRGSEETAGDAISAGVTDYLQKGGSEKYEILAKRIRNYVERRRAQRQRQRQVDAIETAQEGISILDEDGRFVYVNEAYADLYGYEPEEMVGEGWEILYPEEEVERVEDEILPEVNEKGSWNGETTGVRSDGSTFVEDHTLSTTDEGGLVCTVRDITERKEHVRRLETLIDNLPGMVYRCKNRTGWPMESVRGEVEDVTGYTRTELEGREGVYGREVIHPDDRDEVWEAVQDAVEDDEIFEITYRIVTKGGDTKWVFERGQGIDPQEGRRGGDGESIEGFIMNAERSG